MADHTTAVAGGRGGSRDDRVGGDAKTAQTEFEKRPVLHTPIRGRVEQSHLLTELPVVEEPMTDGVARGKHG